jgi:putative peptidoglycan lipid II flippase
MSKIEKTATAITSMILLSNIIGIVREMLLASYFGVSFVVDAYLMAQSIAFMVFTGIMAAIAASFVPLYSRENALNGSAAGNRFTSGTINLVALLSIMLGLIGNIFADQIISVIAYGFSAQVHQLTVHFIRIGFIVVSIFSINEIIKNYLYCNNGFIIEKISGLVVNIINIIFIILSGIYNHRWLMYGYLFGYSVYLLLCWYFARSKGFRYNFVLPDKATCWKIMVMVFPVFIGTTAWQINSMVNKFLASGLSEGSVAILGYAVRINGMLVSLLTTAILLMTYPQLAKHVAKSNMPQFKQNFFRDMNLLIMILIPLTFGTIALAKPGVSILYERGQFSPDTVLKVSGVLIFYSLGMLGSGMNSIIAKAFYAMQDSKTPMQIGFLNIFFNMAISLMLIRPMAYYGLALAASLSSLLVVIPYAVLLRKKIGRIDYRDSLLILLKSTGAALLMSLATYEIYQILSGIIIGGFPGKMILLTTAVLSGASVYLFLLWLFKVKETEILIHIIKSTFRRLSL